jgi:hypothetical protein
LKREYKLDTSIRDKPVLSVDDLLLVLHYHWALDTWVYPNEEQRLLLALLFLFAAYTGSRPCSLVDAAVKKLDKRTQKTAEDGIVSLEGSADEYDSKSECSDEPIDEEGGLPFADADMEELKSVLYKHVTILAVKVKDRTVLAMFITVIHTKGEDRKPQPYVYHSTYLFANNLTSL